jgi:hypothetical protein
MMKTYSLPLRGLLATLAAFVTLAARAELPTARLTALQPFAGQRGTTVDVKVVGQDLDDLAALRFSDPRITAKLKSPDTFAVTIPADVQPELCDVRAVGRYGASNPRAFCVEALPVASAKPGNTSPGGAAPIAVGRVLCATAEANAVQYFKLSLKKGQRVIVEVDGRSVDSRIDPSTVLADAGGRDLAISRRGDVLDFTPREDGEYVLRIYDATYRGGPDVFYRLAVHTGPYVEYAQPAAGVAGTRSKFTLFGRNLPGGKPAQAGKGLEQLDVEIELPADPEAAAATLGYVPSVEAPLDEFDYRLTTPAGVSNAVRIAYATAPTVVAETAAARESSSAAASAGQRVAVPCEVCGRFGARARQHAFTFDAAAGSAYVVEVFCNRMGNAPAAPFLLIQKLKKGDKGAADAWVDVQEVYDSPLNVGGNELRTLNRDPAYRLEAKEAGTYRAVVRDLFSTPADGAGVAFRLAVRSPSPDFRLAVVPASPPQEKDSKEVPLWTPLLRRGGAVPLKVIAIRRDGFDGEIEVNADHLPPGVTCAPVRLGKADTVAPLLLVADDKAEAGAAPIRVTGTATVNGAPVTRVARPGTVATSDYNKTDKVAEVSSRRARELLIAVAPEDAPLTIAPAKDAAGGAIETFAFNKLSIPFKVTKRGEFGAAIPLKLTGHPLLEKLKEVNVDKAGDTAAVELDLAALKVPPGVYTLYVESLAKVKYRANAQAAKAAEDAAKSADKTAAELAAAVKAAEAKMAKVKPDAPDRAELEKAAKAAAAKMKEAEAAKTAAAAKAKEMAAKSAAKDLSASFYSTPVRLTVAAAPVSVAPPTDAVKIDAGGKAEAEVALKRLPGFADPVELTITAPATAKGLAGKATAAKDATTAKLAITADAKTPAGEYPVKVTAAMKVNGQAVTVDQTMTVKVTAKAGTPAPEKKK